jgi:hypothetical protein
MPEPEDGIEQIIEAAIKRYIVGDPAALRRAILEALWEAGYDVTCRPDLIPIRRNPGEGTAASPYTAEQEREARGLSPAGLFQRLADEPRNALLRDKISEVAGKFDSGG